MALFKTTKNRQNPDERMGNNGNLQETLNSHYYLPNDLQTTSKYTIHAHSKICFQYRKRAVIMLHTITYYKRVQLLILKLTPSL